MMEMLRKFIFLIILINLVIRNSCEEGDDDLYQNFEDEEQKFINLFEKSSNNNNNNANPIKSGIVEDEGDGEEMGGSEKQDENFRLLFNHMRAYRDKNRLIGNENDGEIKGKIFFYYKIKKNIL